MDRREAVAISAGTVVGLLGLPGRPAAASFRVRPSGRLKQSASRWCYGKIPLPDLCRAAKSIGLAGIDLLQPEDWPVVREQGLVCSMGYPTKRDDFIAWKQIQESLQHW